MWNSGRVMFSSGCRVFCVFGIYEFSGFVSCWKSLFFLKEKIGIREVLGSRVVFDFGFWGVLCFCFYGCLGVFCLVIGVFYRCFSVNWIKFFRFWIRKFSVLGFVFRGFFMVRIMVWFGYYFFFYSLVVIIDGRFWFCLGY